MEVMPCWLVSPETLSSVFPLEEDLFDLAIFDEASQLAVHYSVPAVYRAKKIVIAGDEQQLRPFDLFGALGVQSDDDEPDDDDSDASVTEHESLLTLAKTRFPEEMLACHYRSRYEELIEFSNQGFYKGRLITMPSAKGVGVAPIEWKKVSGVWEKRRNQTEASEVLNLVFELLTSDESRSIGVITFNSTQQVEILDQIDQRSAEDPEFAVAIAKAQNPPSGNRDAAFFVKNIENVQGDERDIIIFSIGYAPDPSGRVYNRFGSLNKDGGDNRLNVAVSRARERIYVVSSVEPEQLDVANSRNRGPRLLRSYLSFAKAVASHTVEQRDAVLRDINPDLDRRVKQVGHFDSPLEEEIFEALSGRGLTVVPQVGVSGYRIDLGIVDPRDPTRYLLGIECDGAAYHSAISARERDAYRQRFLESRGWKIHRIWSRNWWRDKDAEIRSVLDILKRLT
ncbi:MAG: AAA domain-containing protein [Planctomycetota bacterium]